MKRLKIETTGKPDETAVYDVLMDDFSVELAHMIEYTRLCGIDMEVSDEPRTVLKLWR